MYYFAVVPSILPHHGDTRRDFTPYMVTVGHSYADMNTANSAMRELNRRGIKCHFAVIDERGVL